MFVWIARVAHSEINCVAQACTWAVVTQPQDSRVLRLLAGQEKNSLHSAPGAFQPIELQLSSQVCAEDNEEAHITFE